jgi:PIN domain nuclease of toxin-antitoxin system
MVIFDTCAVIEQCLAQPSFSKKCLKLVQKEVFVPSICFAEIACKVKTKKLFMELSPRELFLKYSEIPDVAIISIDTELWLDSIELTWTNKDPADRLIVSCAMKWKAPIVTTDQKMKTFYKTVIW